MQNVGVVVLVCQYNDISNLGREVCVVSKGCVRKGDQTQVLMVEFDKSQASSAVFLLPLDAFIQEVNLVSGDLTSGLCSEREIKCSLWLSDCGKICSAGSLCDVLVLD